MPLSEFRRKKLLYVFKVFFDVNRSGTIEKKDFELAIENICKMRGWTEGSRKEDTKTTLLTIWEGLKQRADVNQDGQISEDEWCKMWEDYSKDPSKPLDWQKKYMDFMFELVDSSGDGNIDESEFTSVCTSYGIDLKESTEAYKKFSSNDTVNVTREVFAELWKDFFTSDDPNVAGNFIFGKISFD